MRHCYTLSKDERLKSVVRIENLFNKGKSFLIFPFLVCYTIDSEYDVNDSKMLVSVSKHLFKHAVDRNRMKRLIREAYRLRKPLLQGVTPRHYSIAFVYKGKQIIDFATVSSAMDAVIAKFSAILAEE